MAVYDLADGTRIRIRPVRPEDAPHIQEGFQRLSPDSVYKRFFTMKKSLTEEELRYLTTCDGIDHVGLLVARLDERQTEVEGLAVARWIRDPQNPQEAHAAFIVVDPWQRKGIGTLLAQELATSAKAQDVHHWKAETWADNAAGKRLLEKIGKIEEYKISTGVAEMKIRLKP